MRGELSRRAVSGPMRREQHEVVELDGREPRESAAIVQAAEGKASVALEAVPAEHPGLESFATHGLHGIAKDRLYVSDLYRHARSGSAQLLPLTLFGRR